MLRLEEIKKQIHPAMYDLLKAREIEKLRPAQSKAIESGLFEGKSLLVCTPTASGKTLVAELAFTNAILNKKGKAIYVVPLKALGSEKYNSFKKQYSKLFKTGISVGDFDSSDPQLHTYDLIITTSEKLDSLLRHKISWIKDVSVIIIDEIHLLNDPGRGPTLEIIITILRQLLREVQIIGLSATIGNEEELASWLDAELVHDTWRPVTLKKGVYFDGTIEFDE